jgi:hypothetical protein
MCVCRVRSPLLADLADILGSSHSAAAAYNLKLSREPELVGVHSSFVQEQMNCVGYNGILHLCSDFPGAHGSWPGRGMRMCIKTGGRYLKIAVCIFHLHVTDCLRPPRHPLGASKKQRETCSSGYLLVVTHLATNPPVRCLTRAEQMGSLAFKGLCSYVENKLILALRIVSGVCLRPPNDCPQSLEGRCHSFRREPTESTSSLRSQPLLVSNQSIAESFAESIAGLPFACSVGHRPLQDSRHPCS